MEYGYYYLLLKLPTQNTVAVYVVRLPSPVYAVNVTTKFRKGQWSVSLLLPAQNIYQLQILHNINLHLKEKSSIQGNFSSFSMLTQFINLHIKNNNNK